jgi:hypothetical protein
LTGNLQERRLRFVPPRLPRHQRFEERERRVQHQAALLLGDDHRLLPRFLDVELQKREDDARIARILVEGGEIPAEANGGKPLRASADGHRSDRRRTDDRTRCKRRHR